MKMLSGYDYVPLEEVEWMQAAGVDLTTIEKVEGTFVRRPKGKNIHAKGCSQVRGIKVVEEKISLIYANKKPVHAACSNWALKWNRSQADYLEAGMHLGYIEKTVREAEAGDAVKTLEVADLLSKDITFKACEALNMPDWVDAQLKRLHAAQLKVVVKSPAEAIRPYVAWRISMPLETLQVADPIVRPLRIVQEGWVEWIDQHSAGRTFKEAREQVQKSYPAVDFNNIFPIWEKELKKVCKISYQNIYYAVSCSTYALDSSADDLLKVRSDYPSMQKVEAGRVVILMRVPEPVAWWLEENSRLQLTAIDTDPGDGPHILETAVTFWDAGERSPSSAAKRALQTARLV